MKMEARATADVAATRKACRKTPCTSCAARSAMRQQSANEEFPCKLSVHMLSASAGVPRSFKRCHKRCSLTDLSVHIMCYLNMPGRHSLMLAYPNSQPHQICAVHGHSFSRVNVIRLVEAGRQAETRQCRESARRAQRLPDVPAAT